MAYFNARSLVNRSASLEVDVYSKNFDIIAITEPHLDESVNSAALFPSNFRVYRRDRNRRGGGVLVAVSDKIICNQRDVLEESDIELLMLDIHYSKNKSLVVCKGCEMIVRQQLVWFWITNEVFIPEQFGFLKGKSCLSQLLFSFYDWARERKKGLTTDVIF